MLEMLFKSMLPPEAAKRLSSYRRPLTRSELTSLTYGLVPNSLVEHFCFSTSPVERDTTVGAVMTIMLRPGHWTLDELVTLITGIDQSPLAPEHFEDFPLLFKIALVHQTLAATFPDRTLDQILETLIDLVLLQARKDADVFHELRMKRTPPLLSSEDFAALNIAHIEPHFSHNPANLEVAA